MFRYSYNSQNQCNKTKHCYLLSVVNGGYPGNKRERLYLTYDGLMGSNLVCDYFLVQTVTC